MQKKRLHDAVLFLILCLPAWCLAATPIPAAPPVSASSHILMDFHSGRLLAEKNADQPMEPASITKMMATYVVFSELKAGRLQLSDEVLISNNARSMPGSRSFIEAGTRVSVEDLLRGMVIQSGNDATVALAEHIAGSEETFAALMNQHAQQLGMSQSHFKNSTGLPAEGHLMTARDIATLARATIAHFPTLYAYYAERKFTYNGITQHNRNKLLWRDDTVDGLKTGHTEAAGYCLAATAVRDDMRIISVVLGDKSEEARAVSSLALLNYGFRFYETRKLFTAGHILKQTPVYKGKQDTLPVGIEQDLYVTFPRGRFEKLQATLSVMPRLIAPLEKGRTLGKVTVSLDGVAVTEREVVSLQAAEEAGFIGRMVDGIKLWFD